ncbi:ribonuclease H2 subunit C [Planococcus citri]|uniref:ribonuclease H2 subunit C n=1 Tax=Planococcus citri TaxID=170843 RepID=UPI0031F74014
MEICLKPDEPVTEDNNINYIPCSINFNGKAKVSSYFKETAGTDGEKLASFRGRPLHGSEVKIPEGYCGYVLKKQPEDCDSSTKCYSIEQSFKKFAYWNLDKKPTSNDAIVSALDWFDISDALHSKIEPGLKNGNGVES